MSTLEDTGTLANGHFGDKKKMCQNCVSLTPKAMTFLAAFRTNLSTTDMSVIQKYI